MATRTHEALRIELAADAVAGLIHGIRCTPVPSDYPIGDPRSGQLTLQLELSVLWEGSSWLWRQAGYRLTERAQYVVTAGDFWRHALHVATAAEDFTPRHVEYSDGESLQRVPVKSAVELAAVLLHLEQIGARQTKVETVAEHVIPAIDPRDIDRIEGPRVLVEVDGYRVPVSVEDARAMGAECAPVLV